MLSCDTFVLPAEANFFGSNLMAKNSDRPIGEAQALTWTDGAEHARGETVQCTYISVPQAEKTYGVLGSKPYWIWGYEMGVNEKGVMIGNEAQGSKAAESGCENELLGMDLLRLGLERGATAREAMEVITALLEEYGQNANASRLYDKRYENSFFIADREEIWLLETAGRMWAAKRIEEPYAISNCYTIVKPDECSEALEKYARDKGWLAADERFNFAKAYTAPAARQTGAVPRMRRLRVLLEAEDEPLDAVTIKAILRDHFEGTLIEPRFGASFGTFPSICMHAMTWDGSQTAASMICRWTENVGPVMRYAYSLPCTSVYIPAYCTGALPPLMSASGEKFDENSLWWLFERLATAVSADYERYAPFARIGAANLDEEIETQAAKAERAAARAAREGRHEEAKAVLNEAMNQSARQAAAFAIKQFEQIRAAIRKRGGISGVRKEFIEEYCERVGMEVW